MVDQVTTYVASTLYRDLFTRKVIGTESAFSSSFHTHVNTVSSNRRRIAGTTHRFWQASYVVGFHFDIFHVLAGSSNVFGSNVFTVQVFYKTTKFTPQGFGFVFFGIGNDYGFTTT